MMRINEDCLRCVSDRQMVDKQDLSEGAELWCWQENGGRVTMVMVPGKWTGGDPRNGRWEAGRLVARGVVERDCGMV